MQISTHLLKVKRPGIVKKTAILQHNFERGHRTKPLFGSPLSDGFGFWHKVKLKLWKR